MKRIRHSWFSIIGVVALLFAQFTVSAYACPMDAPGASVGTTRDGQTMRKEQPASDGNNRGSPNLCLAHCLSGSANMDQLHPPTLPDVVLLGVVLLLSVPAPPPSPIVITPDLRYSTDPPPRLRFSVLRI